MADGWQLLEGDCVKVMQALKAESVDVIVCDPPYGLEFMGKDWDRFWKHATGFESEYGPRWSAREPGRIKQVHENSRAYQEWCEMLARECLRESGRNSIRTWSRPSKRAGVSRHSVGRAAASTHSGRPAARASRWSTHDILSVSAH